MTDLKLMRYIGAGGFGRVRVVSFRNQYLALKSVRKALIESYGCAAQILKERKLLYESRGCPFIVHLHRTFRTQRHVHFLMELCLGGDLYSYTRSFESSFIPEKNAKFIVACIKEALQFLHSRNYIFRDVKEENILIDAFGWCKLADFGFCEVLQRGEHLNRFCGSKPYMAPELITLTPYGHGVDLWAFGITIYGVIAGELPFYGDKELKQLIVNGFDNYEFHENITKHARSIIKALCRKEPEKRLGYKSLADLERRAWLRDFNWKGLRAQTMVSPIVREFTSVDDTHYFNPRMDLLTEHTLDDGVNDPPIKDPAGWDADF